MTDSHHDHAPCAHSGASAPETVIDPACGMSVDPARYAGDDPRRAEPAPEGAIWTCPMHPEVQQLSPGSCPICGMALEPMTPMLSDGPSHEYADMKRRFVFGLLLALPVAALE